MSASKEKKKDRGAADFQVNEQELEALQQRITDRKIEDKDWDLIERYLLLLLRLSRVLQYGKIRIKKIARMLFGKRTEKEKKKGPPENPPPSSSNDRETPFDSAQRKQDAASGSAAENQGANKRKGHGRRPASDYQNAETVICPLCHNKPGELCPACGRGRLRQLPDEVTIRFTGNPPVTATKYAQERVRCDTCGQIFKADLPKEAGEEKYDASAKTSIVMSKYGSGVPFYRLGAQQSQQLVPLAPSTQWELCEQAADFVLPVYLEIERQAARAELIFIDDTPQLVLEAGKKQPMTGVVARAGERWVTLYLTGPDAAGKKISVLLEARPQGLPPPLQMSYALAGNQQDVIQVIVLLCLVHCRRQFFEVKEFYPEVCGPVLEAIRQVYGLNTRSGFFSMSTFSNSISTFPVCSACVPEPMPK